MPLSHFLPPTLRTLEIEPTESWIHPAAFNAVRSTFADLDRLAQLSISCFGQPRSEVPLDRHWIHDVVAQLPRPSSITHLCLVHCVMTETLRHAVAYLDRLTKLSLTPIRDPQSHFDADRLLDSTLRGITSTRLTSLVLDLDNDAIQLDCNSLVHLTSLNVLKVKAAGINPANLVALVHLSDLRKVRIRSDSIQNILDRWTFLRLMESWPKIHQVFFPCYWQDLVPSEIHLADLAMVASVCPLLRRLDMQICLDEGTALPTATPAFHPDMHASLCTSRIVRRDATRCLSFIKALACSKVTVSDQDRWLTCERLEGAHPWRVQWIGNLWEGPPPPISYRFEASDSEFDPHE